MDDGHAVGVLVDLPHRRVRLQVEPGGQGLAQGPVPALGELVVFLGAFAQESREVRQAEMGGVDAVVQAEQGLHRDRRLPGAAVGEAVDSLLYGNAVALLAGHTRKAIGEPAQQVGDLVAQRRVGKPAGGAVQHVRRAHQPGDDRGQQRRREAGQDRQQR